MTDKDKAYLLKELTRTIDESDSTAAFCLCQRWILKNVLALLNEQEPKLMLEVEDDDLYAWSPEDVSYYCPRPECGKEISYDYNFCPYCGQAVKLND